jgi:hypothetical protein
MDPKQTRLHYHIVNYLAPLYNPNKDDIHGIIFSIKYKKIFCAVKIAKRKYEVMIMDELNKIGTVEVKILKHEL